MTISKTLTLTSKVDVIDNGVLQDSIEKSDEVVLINNTVDGNSVNNEELIDTLYERGCKVIISNKFSSNFNAKAINQDILAIEVSRFFLDKIIEANKKSPVKLFIDLPGLELMIVDSGEKEYFELSEYNVEGYKNGKDDIENLHTVWDEISYSAGEETFQCAID